MLADAVGRRSLGLDSDERHCSDDRPRERARLPLRSRADEPVAERPAYHDGDVFEYLDRFENLDCKRWQITGHDADGSLISACGDNVAYFSAQTAAWLRIIGKGGKELVKFDPTSPALPFPLHVGSTWHGKSTVSTPDQIVSPGLDETCKVTSFETVAIAAGNMSAFRYVCATEWSVWPLHGTSPKPVGTLRRSRSW